MNWKYLTLNDAKNVLEVTNEDNLLTELIVLAEGVIDKYLWDTDFNAKVITNERHSSNGTWPYYLDYVPIVFTHAGGTGVTWAEWTDYIQNDRQIIFASTIPLGNYGNDTFDVIEFTYTKSNDIPSNIRVAMLQLVSELYNQRRMAGVKNFSQGDLSITFGDGGFWASKDKMTHIKSLLAPFKRVNVQS